MQNLQEENKSNRKSLNNCLILHARAKIKQKVKVSIKNLRKT